MRKLMLGVMLAMMTTPAIGAAWVSIGKGGYGSSFYYNSESLKSYGTTMIQVWTKEFPAPKPTEQTAYYETLMYYNCTEGTSAIRSQSKFKKDLTYTESEDPYASLHMSPIRPETMDEIFLKKLCH